MAGVYVPAWRAAFGHILTPALVSDASLADRVPGFLAQPVRLVVVVADVVSGFACGDPATGMLEVVYCHPRVWGTGAAHALMARAEVDLRAEGQQPWLWVWEANRRALNFYQSRGWAPDGQHRTARLAGEEFRYQRWTHPRATTR